MEKSEKLSSDKPYFVVGDYVVHKPEGQVPDFYTPNYFKNGRTFMVTRIDIKPTCQLLYLDAKDIAVSRGGWVSYRFMLSDKNGNIIDDPYGYSNRS